MLLASLPSSMVNDRFFVLTAVASISTHNHNGFLCLPFSITGSGDTARYCMMSSTMLSVALRQISGQPFKHNRQVIDYSSSPWEIHNLSEN